MVLGKKKIRLVMTTELKSTRLTLLKGALIEKCGFWSAALSVCGSVSSTCWDTTNTWENLLAFSKNYCTTFLCFSAFSLWRCYFSLRSLNWPSAKWTNTTLSYKHLKTYFTQVSGNFHSHSFKMLSSATTLEFASWLCFWFSTSVSLWVYSHQWW